MNDIKEFWLLEHTVNGVELSDHVFFSYTKIKLTWGWEFVHFSGQQSGNLMGYQPLLTSWEYTQVPYSQPKWSSCAKYESLV